jgi:WD40 repeat protein
MSSAVRTIRIFVSSPSDVEHERRRVSRVTERLNSELAGIVQFETIRWETRHYKAHTTFQSQIPEAAECDIVIAIFWSRLGSELPRNFVRMPNGNAYPSGTAYEVLTALQARQNRLFPDVYVFKKEKEQLIPLSDNEKIAEARQQWERLSTFFEQWFISRSGHYLAAFHVFQTPDDFEIRVESLLREWTEENVLRGQSTLWPVTIKGSPFRGLAAFGTKHASMFFGRTRDVAKALDALKDARDRGCPFLLLVGPSGVGKSSFARAGLVPRLTAPGAVTNVDVWRVAVMRPTEMLGGPLFALASRLFDGLGAIPDDDSGRPPALPELAGSDHPTPKELADLFAHADSSSVKPILRTLDKIGETTFGDAGFDRSIQVDLLLIIDQFDELLVSGSVSSEGERFARLLAAFAETGRIWIVATLRADLYGRFLKEPSLFALKTRGVMFDVVAPGPAELAEIIRKPADAADLVYAIDPTSGESLDERLLREADRPDMLPLLQFALNRLFEQRETKDGRTYLTFEAYENVGGLGGAVETVAERALSVLGETEISTLPRLLRLLAKSDEQARRSIESNPVTICTAALGEVASDSSCHRLTQVLVEARILLISGERDSATVRLAHQRILTSWQRASQIIRENAEFFRIRDEVEAQRRRWELSRRRNELLVPRGLPLAEAERLVLIYGNELGAELLGFVKASGTRARKRQRLAAFAAAVFFFVAVGAISVGFVAHRYQLRAVAESERANDQRNLAEREWKRAERERNDALIVQSRFLAEQANRHNKEGDFGTGMLLALEALPDRSAGIARPYTAQAEDALFEARQNLQELGVIVKHTSSLKSPALSPDGKLLALASADNTARIFDMTTFKEVSVLRGHSDRVFSVAFSSDGAHLVTASEDKTARIWDTTTFKELGILRGHTEGLWSAEFSPDDSRILTASEDGTARLWDTSTLLQVGVIHASNDWIERASFSPDGQLLATGSRDKTARLWDAHTLNSVHTFTHDSGVLDVSFSRDGKLLLTTSDEAVKLWAVDTEMQVKAWRSPGPWGAWSAKFSPDGENVVIALADHTARVWNLHSGDESHVFRGHTDEVLNAIYSNDGTQIITTSRDYTARRWSVERNNTPITLAGHADEIWGASFSPDGRYLVTASRDKTAKLWNISSRALVRTFAGHVAEVSSARFSPNGKFAATTSWDTTIIVWNVESGKEEGVFRGHSDGVVNCAFTPDGLQLISVAKDNTVRIWNVATHTELYVLKKYEYTPWSVAISPDGKLAAISSLDSNIYLWDIAARKEIGAFFGHDRAVVSASFSPSGQHLLSASRDKTARLWDVRTRREVGIYRGDDEISSVAFSPDGRRIVIGSNFRDKAARILDSTSMSQIASLRGHNGTIYAASFSPDGHQVMTASADKFARLWPVFDTTDELIARAKVEVPRCLTLEQRKAYFLTPDQPGWCYELDKWPRLPRFGLRASALDSELARNLGLANGYGAMVVEVFEGFPAANSGLRGGDIVIAVNGETVKGSQAFITALNRSKGISPVGVSAIRDGKPLELVLVPRF